MSTQSDQIKLLFQRVVEIGKKVKTGHAILRTIADPLETYFKVAGANGSLVRIADEDLRGLLSISIEAKDFARSFAECGKRDENGKQKWKDATWIIGNLTQGSAGARQKNQDGIMVLQDLKAKVDTIKEITNVADGLSDAIMGLQNIDIKNVADNLTSLAAANFVVWKDIKTINAATRSNLTSFTPNIDLAIQYLRRM